MHLLNSSGGLQSSQQASPLDIPLQLQTFSSDLQLEPTSRIFALQSSDCNPDEGSDCRSELTAPERLITGAAAARTRGKLFSPQVLLKCSCMQALLWSLLHCHSITSCSDNSYKWFSRVLNGSLTTVLKTNEQNRSYQAICKLMMDWTSLDTKHLNLFSLMKVIPSGWPYAICKKWKSPNKVRNVACLH